ncbi:hypothetical protein K438DRAFT_2006954 [Mycena galopus ATCC 62051]|nr:hypothetical protein K438DRAFT_2006954 [Mycena galopus ATCC 62051]
MDNPQNSGVKSDQKNGALPPKNESQPPKDGVGGRGGLGEGPKVVLPIRDTIGREIEITPMAVDEFCTKYDLGDDILHHLDNDKVELDNIGALIEAKNLMRPEYGLKLGHVAEVKWALKLFLLSCPGGKEVRIGPGLYKPTLIGGIGGDGGAGEKQGGDGGTGKAYEITLQDWYRFGSMYGKSIAVKAVKANPNGEKGTPSSDVTKKDGGIGGGKGGVGGFGSQVGGDGGTGGAPVIPLEAVGTFQWIKGGHGGTGGAAVEKGGKGGTGEGPKFPKPLVEIEQADRPRVHAKNIRLKEDEGINPKLLEFNINLTKKLIDRLHELGFRTVCGLFEIYDTDLDAEPFKTGNKDSLKFALEQFLKLSK